MSARNALFLVIGLIVWIFCHTAWIFIGYGTYYIGTAFIIFVSAFIINNETKKKSYHKVITRLFLFLSFSNLLDELFFDPKVVDINEYIISVLYLIYIICGNYFKTLNIFSKH